MPTVEGGVDPSADVVEVVFEALVQGFIGVDSALQANEPDQSPARRAHHRPRQSSFNRHSVVPFDLMGRVLRLVPRPRRTVAAAVGQSYFALLTGLLVIIAGTLVLTLAVSLLGL